jgi:hypothetical protein
MNSIRALKAIIVAVLFVLGNVTVTHAIDGTPSWTYSQISGPPGGNLFINAPQLAFDHYGTPAVTWARVDRFSLTDNAVFHSELTPLGIWSTRQMATGNGIGIATSQSYDRSERPHVAWLNNDGALRGSFNFQSTLNITGGPAPSTSNPTLSLQHDLAGNLRGMYVGSSPGVFGSISWTGSAYSAASMMTLANVGTVRYASMTTDTQGKRHVIANATITPGNNPAVYLASEPRNSTTWASAVLLTADAVTGVDITRSPTDGRVAFSYAIRNGSTSELWYAESNGGLVNSTLVLSTTDFNLGDLSLAMDGTDGQPAIAFEDTTNARLLFAYRNPAGFWNSSMVIDNAISVSGPDGRRQAPSLVFNDYGTGWPAVAYVGSNGALKVAFDPPGALPEPASLALLAGGLLVAARRRRGRGVMSA